MANSAHGPVGGHSPKPTEFGRVAELFAGVGGFRLGLESSGWRVILSNQWEPSTKSQQASDIYVARFGPQGHSNVDIKELIDDWESGSNSALLPDHDLLVGGFPCQDYSVAKSLGSAEGLVGKKGVLWWEIHRILKHKRPPFVFLENVDRLLKSPASQRGRDFAVMLSSLSAIGYSVEWRVVNAADYGFPQRRRRVFIIGRHRLVERSDLNLTPEFLTGTGAIARALHVESGIGPSNQFQLPADIVYLSEIFNVGGKVSPFKSAGLMKDGFVYTAEVQPVSAALMPISSVLVDESEVPSEYFLAEESLGEWRRQKGAKKIERVAASTGHRYTYSEGAMSFPDSLALPARTILTGEGGTAASRFKHVVEAPSGRLRRLLPIELERLNGFPDDWTRWGTGGSEVSPARRAFLMGNALVVGLVEKIGSELHSEFMDYLNHS